MLCENIERTKAGAPRRFSLSYFSGLQFGLTTSCENGPKPWSIDVNNKSRLHRPYTCLCLGKNQPKTGLHDTNFVGILPPYVRSLTRSAQKDLFSGDNASQGFSSTTV